MGEGLGRDKVFPCPLSNVVHLVLRLSAPSSLALNFNQKNDIRKPTGPCLMSIPFRLPSLHYARKVFILPLSLTDTAYFKSPLENSYRFDKYIFSIQRTFSIMDHFFRQFHWSSLFRLYWTQTFFRQGNSYTGESGGRVRCCNLSIKKTSTKKTIFQFRVSFQPTV